jgi:hypothetical protein
MPAAARTMTLEQKTPTSLEVGTRPAGEVRINPAFFQERAGKCCGIHRESRLKVFYYLGGLLILFDPIEQRVDQRVLVG